MRSASRGAGAPHAPAGAAAGVPGVGARFHGAACSSARTSSSSKVVRQILAVYEARCRCAPAKPLRQPLGRLGATVIADRRSGGAPAVLITGFPSEVTATNCWVVAPGAGEQCIVIDPGIGVDRPAGRGHRRAPAAPGRGAADPRPPRPHLLGACRSARPATSRPTSTPTTARSSPTRGRRCRHARRHAAVRLADLRRARRRPRADRRREGQPRRPRLRGAARARAHPGLGGVRHCPAPTSRSCSAATCCSPARSAAATCPAARWRTWSTRCAR